MYRTGIKTSCRARHKLIGDFGDETVPHEHSYLVEWICGVSELDENGFGVNIDTLNETLNRVIQSIDGKLLNDLPFFANRQTSIENTARYLCESLMKALENQGYPLGTVREWEVKIWESDSAWASYVKSDF